MTLIDWPDSLGVDAAFSDHFGRVSESVYHGDGRYPSEIGLGVFNTGAGRVVYDITAHAKHPAVLKVAHSDVGMQENKSEIHDRKQWGRPLRDRLVPVTNWGNGDLWVVQPKVSSLLFRQSKVAQDYLSHLVQQAGADPVEVYPQNVGEYNGLFVLFDFGGLHGY